MKALQIIESAYRCTIEEQDDPAVWIAHAMKTTGADLSVLLRGNAVNYAVRGQDASGLVFGEVSHAHPPQIDMEITRFLTKGIDVYLVEEDADERGIDASAIMPGIKPIPRQRLPVLFSEHDQIWHW